MKTVDLIPRLAIQFGERFRKQYENLNSLAESIKSRGLITPIAVRADGDDKYTLLAGGRRFRACEMLGMESIPARIYPASTSELDYRAIELAENFDREGLTWQEEAKLRAEIDRLQKDIHGPSVGSDRKAGWTNEKTAKLLGISPASLSLDLRLAKAMEVGGDEVFAGVKTRKDAHKALDKLEEEVLMAELAKRAAEKPFDQRIARLHESYRLGDFFGGIAEIPDSTFNMVEFDPDFAIEDIHEFHEGVDENYVKVDKEAFPQFMARCFDEILRVTLPDAWIIMWYPYEHTGLLQYIVRQKGLHMSVVPGFWIKDDCSHKCTTPYSNLDPQVETFMVIRKGSPVLAKPGRSNAFFFPRLGFNQKTHPFERPLHLMKEILSTFTFQGAKVLVPFLGSGKTLVAAHSLGMEAIGFELSPIYRERFLVKLNSGELEWTL